ncbi:hypothetical protein LTR56_017885 [Elasticomyces elasticus]|nr:hypothetical protein LTR56_017885 [Elasticomyces elasticus]KAK3637137.1 hypothetical protein LTR22_018393 [Elasticomyces elasticus]KAK4914161.1 hypothetical protein LTR49_017593 [Elasticomyces elasticus]
MARHKQATRGNEKKAKNREAQKKFRDRKKEEWKSQAEYILELKRANEALTNENARLRVLLAQLESRHQAAEPSPVPNDSDRTLDIHTQRQASVDSDIPVPMLDVGATGDSCAQEWAPVEWSWDLDFSDPTTAAFEFFEPATSPCETYASFPARPDAFDTGGGYSTDHAVVDAATLPESTALPVLQGTAEQTVMQPASTTTVPASISQYDGAFFESGVNLSPGLLTVQPTSFPNGATESFSSLPCHYAPTNLVSIYFQAAQHHNHAAKLLEMGLQLSFLESTPSLPYSSAYQQPVETLPWLEQWPNSYYTSPLDQILES